MSSTPRSITLTVLAMVAFAGNSLLCRFALTETAIDAASFTTVRLLSGALILWLIVRLRRGRVRDAGSWRSACALFVYAAGFSFAYLSLSAATGALLLFAAVQATMIGYGLCRGERLRPRQWSGLLLAASGLVGLFLPGLTAPPPVGAALMLAAGVAWGIYSLHGAGRSNPLAVTTGNFARAVPIALILSMIMMQGASVDAVGCIYAVASGALASGLGYVLWYAALPALTATGAATVQLSVPVLAALGGVVFLAEPLTLRLILASAAILGGIALVMRKQRT